MDFHIVLRNDNWIFHNGHVVFMGEKQSFCFFLNLQNKSFSWKNYTHKLQDANLNGKKNRVSFVIIIPFMCNCDNLNG